jgi:DUF971 family protein
VQNDLAAEKISASRPGQNPMFHCKLDGHTSTLEAHPMRLEPINIQQIGNELAIHWNDDGESYLNLEMLRRACPCAACGGEPDVLGNIARPNVSYTPESFQLASFNVVGGYALQPRWRDGHDTGLYSFQYLRRLSMPAGSK